MSVLPIAKLATHVVASVGVSKVVGDVIKKNTTVVTTADAVRVWTGGIVIGSIVAETASKHVNERIDAVVNWYKSRNTEENDLTEVS